MEMLLLCPLLILIRSDFRERQVSVPTLLVFGGIQWAICLMESGIMAFAGRMLENFLLLAVWGVATGIWFRWSRFGRKRDHRTGWIGKGDLAFLVCLLPVFPLRHFLFFLLLSLIVSLLYWLLSGKGASFTIPLVSMVGICYLPVLFFRMYGY